MAAAVLGYIFSRELEFPPGSHFSYSNAGWYLVSAMVQNELGIPLSQWVCELLFQVIEIREFSWMKYGPYDAGAIGLSLSGADMHKLGELLLSDGRYQQKQVIPESWIRMMRSPQVQASSSYDRSCALQATGYGFGIWTCDDGIYYSDGSGGKFLIVKPQERMVISVIAEHAEMEDVAGLLSRVLY